MDSRSLKSQSQDMPYSSYSRSYPHTDQINPLIRSQIDYQQYHNQETPADFQRRQYDIHSSSTPEPPSQSSNEQRLFKASKGNISSKEKLINQASPNIFPQGSGRTIDIRHVQPYSLGGGGQNIVQRSSDQYQEALDYYQHYQQLEENDQNDEEIHLTAENLHNDEEFDNERMRGTDEQQEEIGQILNENQELKDELEKTQNKLQKVENQLTQTKQWLREVGAMQQEFTNMKQTADQVLDMENVLIENEILKAKCTELETQVNTLSRNDEEQRIRERMSYERRIKDVAEENSRLIEKTKELIGKLNETNALVENQKQLLDSKDQQIIDLQATYRLLQEEHFKSIRDNNEYKKQLEKKQSNSSENLISINSRERLDRLDLKGYCALRHRSSSKKSIKKPRKNVVEEEFSRDYANNILNQMNQPLELNQTFNLDESKIDHQPLTTVHQLDKNRTLKSGQIFENQDLKSPFRQADGNQKINISISSPTKHNKELMDRCLKLESYCRELVKTNQILDCENRLAIAQLIHLTDSNQLNNLAKAMQLVSDSGKVYSKKNQGLETKRAVIQSTHRYKKVTDAFNTSQINMPRQQSQPRNQKQSLKNLLTLRQNQNSNATGKIAQQITNSSFVIQTGKNNFISTGGVKPRVNFQGQKREAKVNQSMVVQGNRDKIMPYQDMPLKIENQQDNSVVGPVRVLRTEPDVLEEFQQHPYEQSSIEDQKSSNIALKNQALNMESRDLDHAQFIIFLLGYRIEELSQQFTENGVQLQLKKLTDFYYTMGNNKEVVNLRVDRDSQTVLSKFITHH